jgi:hypothetical protein
MLSRILFSTAAAALLAAAAPAIADEHAKRADRDDVASRCDCAGMHAREHARGNAPAKQQVAPPQVQEEDPIVRNQSWGG